MFLIETIKNIRRKRAEKRQQDIEFFDDLKHRVHSAGLVYDKLHEIENAGIRLDVFLDNFKLTNVDTELYVEFDVDETLRVKILRAYIPMWADRLWKDSERPLEIMTLYVNGKEIFPESHEQLEEVANKICVILNRKFEKEYVSRRVSLKDWLEKDDKPKKQLVVEDKRKTSKRKGK